MNNLPSKPLEPIGLFSREQVELLKRDICKGANDLEFKKFLMDCERTRLDPFARQIYSIERYSGGVKTRTTQVSIDGFRLIAQRSGEYAGQLGPEWCGTDGRWRDVWLEDDPPAAARVAALRRDFEKPCWGVARFDAYCQRNKDGSPRNLWRTMADVMIAKCAEALALRKAFPQELSGLYTSDEMMQAEPLPPPKPTQSLAEEMRDEMPDWNTRDPEIVDSADDRGRGAESTAAAPRVTPNQATVAAAAPHSHNMSMAIEAASHGREHLQKYHAGRNSKDKKELEENLEYLKTFYPKGDN